MKLLSLILLSTIFYVHADDEEIDSKEIIKKAEEILINHEEGPDKNWINEQREAMAALKLRRGKFNRASTVDTKASEKLVSEMREAVGPQNNETDNSAIHEAIEELNEIALEGDMIFSAQQIDQITNPDETSTEEGIGAIKDAKTLRAATTNSKLVWNPDQPIPFFIEADLNRNRIMEAIKFWNDTTCLSFVESKTAGTNRLRYFKGSGCWSYVGKQPSFGNQDVSIGNGCDSIGTICHETAHALGFYHTQSRYDRDDFLNVNFNNIQKSLQYNFDKLTPATVTDFGIDYDYGSVMQYNPYAFAINYNTPTSMAKDPNYQNMMGQRDSPAFSDVKQMNLLYKCAAKCSSAASCQNGGIVNPNNCKKCICPKYFGGDTCEKLAESTAPVCNGKELQISGPTSFSAETGLGMTYKFADPATCYYSVTCPAAKKVQIEVSNINATCMEQCPWAGFEINLGTPELSGMYVCCTSGFKKPYTTIANKLYIRGVSKYNNIGMDFKVTCV